MRKIATPYLQCVICGVSEEVLCSNTLNKNQNLSHG